MLSVSRPPAATKSLLPLLSCLVTAMALSGCVSASPEKVAAPAVLAQPAPLLTSYDYQLMTAAFQPLSLPQVAAELASADVVLVGEYHGNQASHLLEMQLLFAMHQHNQQQGRVTQLSMEMFERDQQQLLNRYLQGEIGERYLINEAPAWKNYAGSYRPLVEYAKSQKMPVLAANAPGGLIRCIGRQGEAYLQKMTDAERSLLATTPFAGVPEYADKFFGLMAGSSHNPSARAKQSYAAQLARDNTMAEAIVQALQQKPGSQVLHINGSFHSENHLGTAGAIQRLAPQLKVKVITPVYPQQLEQKQLQQSRDDYFYVLLPQPEEYLDSETEYRNKQMQAMFAEAGEKAKQCR